MLKRFWQDSDNRSAARSETHRHSNKGNFATFYLSKSIFIYNIQPQFGVAASFLNSSILNCSLYAGTGEFTSSNSREVASHTPYFVDDRFIISRPDSLRKQKIT